jgi:hypothetical protein
MIRSLYAVPAMLCLTAAVVTAQAPAADKPAGNPPAAEQPAAQQPTTPRPTTPSPAQPTDTSARATGKVTYTGCVKPGTTAGSWILENAEVQRAGGASAPSAVGTSGASKLTLNLDPAATVNLTPHANHKVEVVGMASPAKPGDASAPSSASAPGTATKFSVESLKMVSATCP